MIELKYFIDDFAQALHDIDRSGVVHKSFRPGIGPFGESDAIKAALAILKKKYSEKYQEAVTQRQPDFLIPHQWQIEFKILRPFGDNGKEAENWSQNLLHPYRGNTSTIGDCFKLLASNREERSAVVVFGYEHDPAQIPLDPCVYGFEILAGQLIGIILSQRVEQKITGLIHPIHQVLRVFGWEVKGRKNSELMGTELFFRK